MIHHSNLARPSEIAAPLQVGEYVPFFLRFLQWICNSVLCDCARVVKRDGCLRFRLTYKPIVHCLSATHRQCGQNLLYGQHTSGNFESSALLAKGEN